MLAQVESFGTLELQVLHVDGLNPVDLPVANTALVTRGHPYQVERSAVINKAQRVNVVTDRLRCLLDW